MTVDLETKPVIPWQLLQQGRGAYLDANYTRSQTDDHFTSSSFSLNSSQCMTRVLPQAIGYESCSESLAGAISLYIVGCFVGCLVGWLVVWLDGWWADGINGGLAGRLVSEWILWKPAQFNFKVWYFDVQNEVCLDIFLFLALHNVNYTTNSFLTMNLAAVWGAFLVPYSLWFKVISVSQYFFLLIWHYSSISTELSCWGLFPLLKVEKTWRCAKPILEFHVCRTHIMIL